MHQLALSVKTVRAHDWPAVGALPANVGTVSISLHLHSLISRVRLFYVTSSMTLYSYRMLLEDVVVGITADASETASFDVHI